MQSPFSTRTSFRLVFALAVAAPLGAQAVAVPGFQAEARPLPQPVKNKGWSGLDVLPDGDLVSFDGQRLVVIDPATGNVRRTLATLGSPAFGAGVRVGPSGQRVFFGESETGAIYAHELTAGTTRKITTLAFNFALAFHPSEGERFLYVSARPGTRAAVVRVDTWTGAHDVIIEATGFSGPARFDRNGDLLFAPSTVPTQILRFARDRVLGAIGPGKLSENDATVFAGRLANAFALARDGEGTLYVSDASSSSSLLETSPAGGGFAKDVARLPGSTLTNLAFRRGPRPFERYGRSGGELWLLASDFGTSHHVVRVVPRRPSLDVAPSSRPIKGTALRYDAAGLPAAFAVWMLGAGLVPEAPLLPLGASGLMFPDFGIVWTAPHVLLTARVGGDGRASLAFRAPNVADVRWTTQVFAGPVQPLPGGTPASPWVTSDAVTVTTR